MASFLTVSSPLFSSSRCSPYLLPSPSISSANQMKKGFIRRLVVYPVNCLSSEPGKDTVSDSKTEPSPSSSSSSVKVSASNSAYKWCAGLGGIGLVETAYLTYVKLSNSDAFCPIGSGTCGDVLSSDYAVVFGIPLPLIGMVAYGLVTILSLELAGQKSFLGISEMYARLGLLGSSTSMAAASAYFLYILSTDLSGATCSYCLFSALLSFSLFFLTLKEVELREVQKVLVLQLCIASLVISSLSISYTSAQPVSPSLAEIDLPYFTTDVTTASSPFSLSLAKHLHSIGAKMYGAFWCSHCLEQKQMFGREATKMLDYVECFPDGYRKGTKIAKACAVAGIEGFPTWVINGQVLSGDQELTELAEKSGFSLGEVSH